jgi:hypothetical protein
MKIEEVSRRGGVENGGRMYIGLSDETIEAMGETAKTKKTKS